MMMVAFPKEFEGARIVAEGRAFAVSVVARSKRAWHDAFFAGGQRITANNQALFRRAPSGSPVLTEAVAYIDCRVRDVVDLGDFVLALGEVDAAEALHADESNLTVNEIIAQHDPRIDQNALLPFEGFDFDLGRLQAAPIAPGGGAPSAEKFRGVYGLRQWGLFFVTAPTSGGGHIHVGGHMIQTSHQPPRMAVAFKKAWPVAAHIRDREPFAMTLASTSQIGEAMLLQQGPVPLTAMPTKLVTTEADGAVSLAGGICWFLCHPEAVHEAGDSWLAIAKVENYRWLDANARNLTTGELRAGGGP